MKVKTYPFPRPFFLAWDVDGKAHWYIEDPLKATDKKAIEIDLADIISSEYGAGNNINPVVVAISAKQISRCIPFSSSQPLSIREGSLYAHFCDMAGRLIEIGEERGNQVGFPFVGTIYDRTGKVIGEAAYSLTGECSDEDDSHSLYCLDGLLKDQFLKNE